jgi:hypothetical protein
MKLQNLFLQRAHYELQHNEGRGYNKPRLIGTVHVVLGQVFLKSADYNPQKSGVAAIAVSDSVLKQGAGLLERCQYDLRHEACAGSVESVLRVMLWHACRQVS